MSAIVASVGGRGRGRGRGRGGRAAALMQRLLSDAPAPPPPAEWRGRDVPAPPAPTTVREVYDGRFEVIKCPKWREQLLDRAAHQRDTATDVAEMVLALDEGVLTEMLVFSVGDSTTCYVAGEPGVWDEVNGKEYHQIHWALRQLSERLDRLVIGPVRDLAKRQRQALQAPSQLSDMPDMPGAAPSSPADLSEHEREQEREATEDHLQELVSLYSKLRTPAFASGLAKTLVTIRAESTR